MSAKKVRVKVTRKKIKFKNIFIALTILLLLVLLVIDMVNLPIKNIYVVGNDILSDKTIIQLADLNDYPSYIGTFFSNIKGKLLKSDVIKSVSVKRTLSRKIYIEVDEYKPLFIYKDKLVMSSTKFVDNIYNVDYVPFVINDIDAIFDKVVNKFDKIDKDILMKISHIEYVPNDVDDERFLLYMIDSNYVYITLSKIDKVNKYNFIVQKLEGKKGIIYLDSGDYVEIKG